MSHVGVVHILDPEVEGYHALTADVPSHGEAHQQSKHDSVSDNNSDNNRVGERTSECVLRLGGRAQVSTWYCQQAGAGTVDFQTHLFDGGSMF